MDRLRAIRYFVASAEAGSFAGAARTLGLTVPAVQKLVVGLERSLDVALLERGPRGLALTAEGAHYLEQCEPLLRHLDAIDDSMRESGRRPRGVLRIGTVAPLARHALGPTLPAFHRRFPELRIDLHLVDGPQDVRAQGLDALLLVGWREDASMVVRHVAWARYAIVGAPSFWARHGVPSRPSELSHLPAFVFRNHEGMALDVWQYERDGVHERVEAKGWLVSDDRDMLVDRVAAGEGIGRFTDLTIRDQVESGRLVPVLQDWSTREAPPIRLMYRPSARALPRVRAFAEFVVELFARLEAERDPRVREKHGDARQVWQALHATYVPLAASEVLRRKGSQDAAKRGA